MNRGQLVKRVGFKLGINVTLGEGDQNEIDFLRDLANDGVVEVLLKTHCYIERGDMTLQAGVSEYRLDSAILAIDDGRGSTPSGIGPYQLITLAEMIAYQSASPVGSGVQKYIALAGTDLLTVAPAPDTGSEVLRFWYVPRPSLMTSDTRDPSTATYGGIPSEYHRAIEYYMLWQASEYDDKQAKRAGEYRLDFENECREVRKRVRHKSGRGLRPAVVGYPARFRSGRNDVYPER